MFLSLVVLQFYVVSLLCYGDNLSKWIVVTANSIMLMGIILILISNGRLKNEKIVVINDQGKFLIDEINKYYYPFGRRVKVIATVRVIDKIKKEKEVHYYVKSYESIKTEKAFAPTYGDLIEFYDVGGTNSYVVYINQEGCRVIRVNIQ